MAALPLLVVDDDPVSRERLREALEGTGRPVVPVGGGDEAVAWLERNVPSAVLLDLVMPAPDGFEVLRRLRADSRLTDVPVIVATAVESDEDIRRVFASGADDYVHKPFRTAELIARVRGQLRMSEYVERLGRRERDAQTLLELTRTLASSLDMHEILFTVVHRLAELTGVDRCSIVLVAQASLVGHVVASSDDPRISDLPIDLEKYPEIREVLGTGHAVVVRDAGVHPLLEGVRRDPSHVGFASLALVPIQHEGRPAGVLFLRTRERSAFSDSDLELVDLVAHATAVALRNARILQALRDDVEAIGFARVEAERRVQRFRRYADFFESAADGMLVLDLEGTVMFANPRARELTGQEEEVIRGLSLRDLVIDAEAQRADELLAGFQAGVYPRGVDLSVRHRAGGTLTASASFGSVLHEERLVLVTLRDVTLERRTALELSKTKEFLERVIESSVDGIVYADLEGLVLLYNRAAARMFGWTPEEVVGRMNVRRLYPPGVAEEVMRLIRAPSTSGAGRLEDHRVDMLGREGQTIAVVLSAALVFDHGVPVGSVGVFTDVRQRLQMEAQLARTQEELRIRERQAIVAELAGAAAHELNQPLTAVLGYAELVRRQLDPATPAHAAAGVIIGEAERMAEIVRKVGKITRYETKSYVGEARILDLEKASSEESRR
ncbi:MAG: PAS domain S-box protein [Polyangiaceae bacterium]|nr:PAS domain S-box protein [Polyangiaceae bacterium]